MLGDLEGDPCMEGSRGSCPRPPMAPPQAFGTSMLRGQCTEISNKQNMCRCLRWDEGFKGRRKRCRDAGGCSMASVGGNDQDAYMVLFYTVALGNSSYSEIREKKS